MISPVVLILIGGIASGAMASQADPLPVRLEGPGAGPHYIGQAIAVRVLVTAAEEEPTIEPPEHPAVEVFIVGRDVRPISAGAIGTIIHETNLYRFDALIVPKKAGRVVVPAFRARVGQQSGASGPIRLEPVVTPAFGRPPWFLGGIGPVEVEVIAQPEAIRLGESTTVSVRLRGPGSFGSLGRPTLRGPDHAELPAELQPLASTLDPATPARTFSTRLRPSEAGTLSLAPILVSWFEPGSRQYQTVGAGGVSIRVDDPPRFDPRAIEVASLEEESAQPSGPIRRVGMAPALTIAGVVLVVIVWQVVREQRRSARRYAARQARRLRSITGSARAEQASAALVGYLHRAIDRPEGVLTPPEVREAIMTLSGDPVLADRAAEVLDSCDAVRYSGRLVPEDRRGGLDDAPALFRELARVRIRVSGRREGRSATAGDAPSDRSERTGWGPGQRQAPTTQKARADGSIKGRS